MNESAEHPLIIGTSQCRKFLFGGEVVCFYVINALHPLWVTTPFAQYPMMPDEVLNVVMPEQCGTYNFGFSCGEDNVDFTFVVG